MAKLKDTSTSGAVFFAVCRGKVRFILDFKKKNLYSSRLLKLYVDR
jgi:hypothetical protein